MGNFPGSSGSRKSLFQLGCPGLRATCVTQAGSALSSVRPLTPSGFAGCHDDDGDDDDGMSVVGPKDSHLKLYSGFHSRVHLCVL